MKKLKSLLIAAALTVVAPTLAVADKLQTILDNGVIRIGAPFDVPRVSISSLPRWLPMVWA
jgi:hypothetical protein